MVSRRFTTKNRTALPRLPLEGDIDLTYRCNCNCRHCWVRLPAGHPSAKRELSINEIGRVAGEARAMGCRLWSISGGEPLLRPDFADIFGLLTDHSLSYALNTNGTLITPAIARLLKRKGTKMVALYGATEDVYDHITRTPGSFAAAMRGFAYLREAKAGFIVQIVPMRDNIHEFDAMVRLSRSLSPVYRVGAPWLYLSACGSATRNREIARQRLDPADVVRLDPPDMMDDEGHGGTPREADPANFFPWGRDDRLFADCIGNHRDFHIDPYGGMTFCSYIHDPPLRFDLRKGPFREGWDKFIPSLADRLRGGAEYLENCGRCEKNLECRWCPVYGYLEHGRYSAKVQYLCNIADQTKIFRENWRRHHRRHFRIAGITIRVDSDLPFMEKTFDPKFEKFQADGPGKEMIVLRHHFFVPAWKKKELGREVYRKPPWAIYCKDRSWIYLDIGPRENGKTVYGAAVFNEGHTRGRIYHSREEIFLQGNLHSITLLPSDQILLARALADRQACFIHASGLVLNGKGILFVGHSDAGKTTAAAILREQGKVLCDDRIIVRRWPEGFRIHGTWSHGDLADVSADDAPLAAILFLKKADENRLAPLGRGMETAGLLAQYVVKSLVTADWWEKILALIDNAAREVPAYRLEFTRSVRMVDTILKIL